MNKDSKDIVFHIDVNSAFLSWTALSLIKNNKSEVDIRKIPSIIGGNLEERKGVVLAKSIPAKKYNIITGEPILTALKKCPNLKVYEPDRKLYYYYSNAMFELLCDYSNTIERYSIDEVFMDMNQYKNNYLSVAQEIKDKIYRELGFTVNIGIGNNKLLAKMASDFPKKDAIHIILKEDIKSKMWPLPVERLFMVGAAAQRKLLDLNIRTIGDLANYNQGILKTIFKSYGNIIYQYANGIDNSEINSGTNNDTKGIGNSTTTSEDIKSAEKALEILLALTESVAKRLRGDNLLCSVIAVSIKTNKFINYSHQKTLLVPTDSTSEIYKWVTLIFKESWKGEPIRLLGVRVTKLKDNGVYQQSMFDEEKNEKLKKLDKTIDELRSKFGEGSLIRSTFIKKEEKKNNEDYLNMGGLYDWTKDK